MLWECAVLRMYVYVKAIAFESSVIYWGTNAVVEPKMVSGKFMNLRFTFGKSLWLL